MPASALRRPITPEERVALQRILDNKASRWGRIRIALLGFVIQWGAVSVAAIVLWQIVALVAKALSGARIGWGTPAATWVLGIAILTIAVWSARYNLRWLKQAKNPRAAIAQDLASGTVLEERHLFTAAKRYQEPEHGGLMYFLRSGDDRVYVVFDYESQDLGVQGGDPKASAFVPRAELSVVRAPETRYVLQQTFSGAALALDGGDIPELGLDPEQWPEPDEFCSWKWDDLERRLEGKPRARSRR